MNYKGHIIFGIFFLIALAIVDKLYFHFFFEQLDLIFFLIYAPLILFSFMLPDMDHQSAKPRLYITILLLIVGLYFLLMKDYVRGTAFVATLLLVWIVPLIPGWKHRGHMHSLIFLGLISLLVLLAINWKIGLVFFVGGFSHLLADKCIKVW